MYAFEWTIGLLLGAMLLAALARRLRVPYPTFLALGGELGNSTASDLAVLDQALAKCRRMNLNTVMLPVYWDLIEPEEGTFDFALVRGAVDRARAHNLHLVFLWFGTWKNSMSCYAPGWVKRDTARFGRVRRTSGEPLEIITPESTAARDAAALIQPSAQANMAFCAWSLFSASSNTTDCGPSITSSVTSSPRCAGRQCMKMASFLARLIRWALT